MLKKEGFMLDIYLVYTNENSNKFWSLVQNGNSFTVTFGKVGTDGQSQEKSFESSEKAQKEGEKLAVSKRKKGYRDAERPEAMKISLPKIEVKEVAVETESGPEAKADDGSITDYFEEVEEICFDPGFMKDASAKDPTPSKENYGKMDDDDDDDEKVASKDKWRSEFIDACRYGHYEKENNYWKLIDQDPDFAKEKEELLQSGLTNVLNRLNDNMRCGRIDQIIRLLERGANFITETPDERFANKNLKIKGPYNNDYANAFLSEYQKDPKPERAREIFRNMNDEVFHDVMNRFANRLKMYMEYLREGSVPENQRKRFDEFPEGKAFSEAYVGLYISFSSDSMSIYTLAGPRLRLFVFEPQEARGVIQTFAEEYMEYFKGKLEELAKEGVFEGLFESGVMLVRHEGSKETLFTTYTLPGEKEKTEDKIKYYETTTDWEKDVDAALMVASSLIFGGYGYRDIERGVKLLERFIDESGSAVVLKTLADAFSYLTSRHPAYFYLSAKEYFGRLDYGWAEDYSARAIREGYPEAQAYNDEVNTTIKHYNKIEEIEKAIEEEKESGQEPETGSFNLTEAKNAWKNQNFDTAFTEEDLYIETKNIIGRARKNGNIYLRFLIEGEEGYREALNYLNNLLEKGYSRMSGGWSEGYAIYVRFVYKPVFIKPLERVDVVKGLKWPKTSTHAFFARAVQYPALRGLVKDYTDRAMDRHSWYLDLTDEYNTIPGTFAATALAFCGMDYLTALHNFTYVVDGEHSYYHQKLPEVIMEYYGNNPKLAPVLYDLAAAAGVYGFYKKINKDVLYSAEFLSCLLDYTGTTIDNKEIENFYTAIESLYGDKGKANLKKLREYAEAAEDNRVKQIYIDFHNAYLTALIECDWSNNYDKVKPLKDAGAIEEDANLPTLENQGAVINSKEAAKRNYITAPNNFNDKFMAFFFPACILNFEDLEYVRGEINKINKLKEKYLYFYYGDFNLRFKDYSINSDDLKYEYGVIAYDGKNKPVILYGMLDAGKIMACIAKKWPKTAQEYEELRLANLKREANLRPTDKEWKHANSILETYLGKADITSRNFHALNTQIKQVPPEEKLAYISARVYLSYFAEVRNDIEAAKSYYEELMTLMPEKRDYWQKKVDETTEILSRY